MLHDPDRPNADEIIDNMNRYRVEDRMKENFERMNRENDRASAIMVAMIVVSAALTAAVIAWGIISVGITIMEHRAEDWPEECVGLNAAECIAYFQERVK